MLKMRQLGWLLVHEPRSRFMHHVSAGGAERRARIAGNIALFPAGWSEGIEPDIVLGSPCRCERARRCVKRPVVPAVRILKGGWFPSSADQDRTPESPFRLL